MNYKKYRVTASGTILVRNINAKDLKKSSFILVNGARIKATITVKRVKKEKFDPDIPSSGHL